MPFYKLLSSSGLSCLEHHFYREAHLNDINCQISCVIYPYYNLLFLCYINIFTGLFVRFIKMKIMTSDGQPRSKNFFVCKSVTSFSFLNRLVLTFINILSSYLLRFSVLFIVIFLLSVVYFYIKIS